MDAYIVEGKRTPLGRSHKDKGIFKDIRADELLAQLIGDFVPRVIEAENVSDVYIGCVGQHLEQGKNIGRLAALLAGMPDTTPGVTINRLCGSSMQAVDFAAMALECGQAEVLLAGGIEHMHHVPMQACIDYHKALFEKREFVFTNMGFTSDKVAQIYSISRKEQDEFALFSHQKAAKGMESGFFAKEIVPVSVGSEIISQDQCPRKNASFEAMQNLKPSFQETGTATAGNSSPLSDGASLTLLANKASCDKFGLKKRAQILDFAVVGLDPCIMGMGPVGSVTKLLKKQNLTVDDIDIFEINEAFASQSIASVKELKLPIEKVNLNGGAIALGHPLGATGARLIVTLFNNMETYDKEIGIAAMCIGHGQGIATLIKRTS